METSTESYVQAHVRRAITREAERQSRWEELRARARRMADRLRARFGDDVRIYLFGSVCDPDRFRLDSDLDLAVEGLSPTEYWEAWAELEPLAQDAGLDIVRIETASNLLRKRILEEGEELTLSPGREKPGDSGP